MADEWQKIINDVRKGKPKGSYLICGEDEFKAESAFKELMDELVPERDRSLNLVILDGAESTWEDTLNELRTASMFGGRKVVAIKDARLGSDPSKAFEKAKSAWREGTEGKQRRAANIMMGILADIDWPLDALSDGDPEYRDADKWKSEAKITLKDDDFQWMDRLLSFARKNNLTPRKSDGSEKLEISIKNLDPSQAVLVLAAKSASKAAGIYKAVAAAGVVLSFDAARSDYQKRSSLKAEIEHALEQSGKKIDAGALQKLELKVGFDLRRAIGEIEKLIVYIGKNQIIRAEDVEAVVPRTREESIFDLTDAIARRDSSAALKLIIDLEGTGHHPLELIGLIHSQLRNLFLAAYYAKELSKKKLWDREMNYGDFQNRAWAAIKKAEEEKSEAGGEKKPKSKRKTKDDRIAEIENSPPSIFPKLHPFVAFNALRYQTNYKPSEFPRAFRIIAAVDERIKRSAGDPLMLLEQAMLAICNRQSTFLDQTN